MPTPIRFVLPFACLVALLVAAGCSKSDPKADASFAKLEAESAEHKANLSKIEAELKKANENINGLRLEFAKAAPGIVNLPPPKEERFEKAEASGKFHFSKDVEGSVGFGEPFTHPPTVEVDSALIAVVETTVSGFKWKARGTDVKSDGTHIPATWTAKGMRKVQPIDAASAAAKAEENTKYGKQIAEQFLKSFVDHKFEENSRFVTADFANRIYSTPGGGNVYEPAMFVRYYGRPSSGKFDEDKRFKSATISTTSLAPGGKELLFTGVLDGEKRKADFTLILKPTPDVSWRIDTFNVTDRPAEKK